MTQEGLPILLFFGESVANKKAFRTIGILVNAEQPRALEVLKVLAAFLLEAGLKILADHAFKVEGKAFKASSLAAVVRQSDLLVVLGGDGTLLKAAQVAAPASRPLLGVNLGRLGYLTPVAVGEMLKVMELALRGQLAVEPRVMLRAEVWREGRIAASLLALNDVVVTKGAVGRIIELEVYVDGQYLTPYRADGLIAATPTGSTAYALSVGGPILHPRLRNLVLAPISPHTLSNRPLVLADSSRIDVAVPESPGSILVTADGRPGFRLRKGDLIRIRKARETTRLLVMKSYSYWEVLRSKLGWKGN